MRNEDNKRGRKKEIDCRYTDEIVCPYCGHEFRDSWDYGMDGNETEVQCENEHCEKFFYAYSYTSVTYISRPKDNTSDNTADLTSDK